MMEDNKHYIPDIESLRVGYECEACFSSYGGYMIWDDEGNATHHEPEDKEAAKNWSKF